MEWTIEGKRDSGRRPRSYLDQINEIDIGSYQALRVRALSRDGSRLLQRLLLINVSFSNLRAKRREKNKH